MYSKVVFEIVHVDLVAAFTVDHCLSAGSGLICTTGMAVAAGAAVSAGPGSSWVGVDGGSSWVGVVHPSSRCIATSTSGCAIDVATGVALDSCVPDKAVS